MPRTAARAALNLPSGRCHKEQYGQPCWALGLIKFNTVPINPTLPEAFQFQQFHPRHSHQTSLRPTGAAITTKQSFLSAAVVWAGPVDAQGIGLGDTCPVRICRWHIRLINVRLVRLALCLCLIYGSLKGLVLCPHPEPTPDAIVEAASRDWIRINEKSFNLRETGGDTYIPSPSYVVASI